MTDSTDESPRAMVDTNVVVYAYDLDDPRKHVITHDLIEQLSNQGRLVLSNQIFNEFCSVMMSPKRKTRLSPDQLVVVLRELAATGEVVPLLAALTFSPPRCHAASRPLVLGRTHLVGGRREQSHGHLHRRLSGRPCRRRSPLRQPIRQQHAAAVIDRNDDGQLGDRQRTVLNSHVGTAGHLP